jgi:hypothetical protein
MARAVSRRSLTAEDRVRALVHMGLWWTEALGQVFLRVLPFSSVSIIPRGSPCPHIIWGMNSGCSSETSSHRTDMNNNIILPFTATCLSGFFLWGIPTSISYALFISPTLLIYPANLVLLVIFQVLTAASMKFRVFWDVAPCSHVDVDRRFRGAYCLHHQVDGQKTLNFALPDMVIII